jgi:hypothetical protein
LAVGSWIDAIEPISHCPSNPPKKAEPIEKISAANLVIQFCGWGALLMWISDPNARTPFSIKHVLILIMGSAAARC